MCDSLDETLLGAQRLQVQPTNMIALSLIQRHLVSDLSVRVAGAFCVELGIEVSVILPPDIEAIIGSQKLCTVSYVQPVTSICAMILRSSFKVCNHHPVHIDNLHIISSSIFQLSHHCNKHVCK